MAKVRFLESLTGSGLFDIGVEFRFRKLEQVHNVECDLCAKFKVNQTLFDRFRHLLWKFEVSKFIDFVLRCDSSF